MYKCYKIVCLTSLYVIASYLDVSVCQGVINPDVPVLPKPPGTRYPLGERSIGSPLLLEVFIELNCPDSAAALPVLKQVVDHYGPERLELIIHQLPLPYHRNGFILTQGLFVIRDNMPDKQFEYMWVMLRQINSLSTDATRNMGDEAVVNRISRYAARATRINRQLFKREIYNYVNEARNVWKFAAARGVAGTPWYFVNGVDLGVSPSIRLTYQDWTTYLDPLINPRNQNITRETSTPAVGERIRQMFSQLRGYKK